MTSELMELAAICEEKALQATKLAIGCRLGGRGSIEWIAEAVNYATVAAALRARATGGERG